MDNEKPNGKLKVATSKNGNKYFTGVCYPKPGEGYFLNITKKSEPRDEYEYTVWLKPIEKKQEKQEETYNNDIPF